MRWGLPLRERLRAFFAGAGACSRFDRFADYSFFPADVAEHFARFVQASQCAAVARFRRLAALGGALLVVSLVVSLVLAPSLSLLLVAAGVVSLPLVSFLWSRSLAASTRSGLPPLDSSWGQLLVERFASDGDRVGSLPGWVLAAGSASPLLAPLLSSLSPAQREVLVVLADRSPRPLGELVEASRALA